MTAPIPGLVRNWNFEPSNVARWDRRQALESLFKHMHRRPAYLAIKALTPKSSWIVYFMYSPQGQLSPSQRFTLERLRHIGLPVCVVCAAPTATQIPETLARYCEALYWKGLSGYDFSGYTIALREISRCSPGADVLVMNDSVFGPFTDLRANIDQAPWALTGFTSSSQISNHIQSYAFILRGVDRQRMADLSTVFFPFVAISSASAVVRLQETRMARVAARHMQVGALWYADHNEVIDPTLVRPFELLDAGFPFLKRSLVGKHLSFVEPGTIETRLEQLGHPVRAL